MAGDLSDLGAVLKDIGDAVGARPLLERALGITEASYHRDHNLVTQIRANPRPPPVEADADQEGRGKMVETVAAIIGQLVIRSGVGGAASQVLGARHSETPGDGTDLLGSQHLSPAPNEWNYVRSSDHNGLPEIEALRNFGLCRDDQSVDPPDFFVCFAQYGANVERRSGRSLNEVGSVVAVV